MNIFLIGATGSTGYEVLKRLVKDGHHVITLVRNPDKLSLDAFQETQKELIRPVKGSIMDTGLLDEHLKGCDIVISTIGTGTSNGYTEVYSQGGKHLLSAMRKTGIKKLITITSGLIDLSDPSTDNFFLNRIIRPNYNKVYYDQTRWETILDETSDIDWICVRPPRLINKAFSGKYRVEDQHCPKGGTSISRADLADFIVKQMSSDEFIHKKPVVAY